MGAEDLAALERMAAPNPVRARELGSAWMRHLRRGDYSGAWKISDAVLRLRAGLACPHLPRHFQRVWNGEPLAGKRVLIRCYHGLGDTIQFIRYAPLVKQSAARVSVWAHPALLGLLRSVRGFDELLPLRGAGVLQLAREDAARPPGASEWSSGTRAAVPSPRRRHHARSPAHRDAARLGLDERPPG